MPWLRTTIILVSALAAGCTLLAVFFWAINAGEGFTHDIVSGY